MINWFECKVKFLKVDEKTGVVKSVTETYLLDAYTFTEAESRFIDQVNKMIRGEFEITKISPAKLSDVFFFDKGDYWYKCKVSIIDVDSNTGREKKKSNQMLILASNLQEAGERLEEKMSSVVAPYEILSINKTNILEVFKHVGDKKQDTAPENQFAANSQIEDELDANDDFEDETEI